MCLLSIIRCLHLLDYYDIIELMKNKIVIYTCVPGPGYAWCCIFSNIRTCLDLVRIAKIKQI